MSGNDINKPLVQGCHSIQGKNINIGKVIIECKTLTQPNSGEVDNPEDRDRHCSQISELQHRIESALKDRYNEITLPSLPWLETFDIPIESYSTLQLESENERKISENINLEHLFDNINEQKRKRILIESQPGFGKTTLAHKIASDWSRGCEYVKHFKFAFFIALREYAASSLEEELKYVIGVESLEDGDFWSVINSEETLLIFDGFDEISGRRRQDIQEILHDNKQEYKMTIVTTCRIGLSGLNRRDIKSIHHGMSLKKEIWDKRITILGISEKNQIEFIEKFVDEDDKQILMPRLAGIIAEREKMFNSPLLLILLAYVTSENQDLEIDTDTDLYKALVDCIIRRSVDKKNPEISSVDFTIFTSCYSEPIFDDCKKKFVRFGKICLDRILKDDLLFGSDTENEFIHQLGFLLKHVTNKCFGQRVRYEGSHLSILEFAAAVYMAHDFATNDNRFRPEDIDMLFKIVYNKKLASMVLPFLCDLLGKGISHLIEKLSRYYVFFWFSSDIVELLIRKCLENGVGEEYFVKIIPPYITLSSQVEYSNSVLVTQYLAKFLVINLDKICYLRKICHHKHLRGLVCSNLYAEDENISDIVQNITCESLSFTSYNNLPYAANGFGRFRRVLSGCKNLYLRRGYENLPSVLEKCITSGILVGEKLNDVIIELGNVEKEVIAKLIECNHIEKLVLVVVGCFRDSIKNLAATVSHLAATNNRLNSLFVVCREFCVGWDDFTVSGEKCFKESNYAIANLEDTGTASDRLDQKVQAIFPFKPSQLYCSCLNSESFGNWNDWDRIVELTLADIAIPNSNQTYIPDFSNFKSLKILTLVISFRSELNEASVENIIRSIKGLNLTRLTIKWFSSYYYFYCSLVNGVRELLQNNSIFCSEGVRFEIILTDVRPDLLDFGTIKLALLSDSKIVFCIGSNTWEIFREIVKHHMNDLLLYNIKYSYASYTVVNNSCPGPGFYFDTDIQHMLELTLS